MFSLNANTYMITIEYIVIIVIITTEQKQKRIKLLFCLRSRIRANIDTENRLFRKTNSSMYITLRYSANSFFTVCYLFTCHVIFK